LLTTTSIRPNGPARGGDQLVAGGQGRPRRSGGAEILLAGLKAAGGQGQSNSRAQPEPEADSDRR
jgi:hypothetical protein